MAAKTFFSEPDRYCSQGCLGRIQNFKGMRLYSGGVDMLQVIASEPATCAPALAQRRLRFGG
jgi:hypothetical protein